MTRWFGIHLNRICPWITEQWVELVEPSVDMVIWLKHRHNNHIHISRFASLLIVWLGDEWRTGSRAYSSTEASLKVGQTQVQCPQVDSYLLYELDLFTSMEWRKWNLGWALIPIQSFPDGNSSICLLCVSCCLPSRCMSLCSFVEFVRKILHLFHGHSVLSPGSELYALSSVQIRDSYCVIRFSILS